MQLSGAQILVQSLKAENVEYVFGYPGGAVLEIYDALYQLHKFEHILVRHEQAAVHAADAYARVSGHGLQRFHPAGGDFRPGAFARSGHRCVSGN